MNDTDYGYMSGNLPFSHPLLVQYRIASSILTHPPFLPMLNPRMEIEIEYCAA